MELKSISRAITSEITKGIDMKLWRYTNSHDWSTGDTQIYIHKLKSKMGMVVMSFYDGHVALYQDCYGSDGSTTN